MALNLFGFTIGKENKALGQSVVLPTPDDGAILGNASGFYGTYLGFDNIYRNESDLIRKYREISMYPECDSAVEDIANETIVFDEDKKAVALNLDELKVSDAIKKKIHAEFDTLYTLLNFDQRGYELFRRWYIDGRLYLHKVVNNASLKDGILELRLIDPRKIKKIKEVEKKVDKNNNTVYEQGSEYYVYSESPQGAQAQQTQPGINDIKLTTDSVCFVPSGLLDMQSNLVLSYLHKAIKPVNQLSYIEDALVIYRISRAPERRIFYIDVGNLPKTKAEQYLKDVMNRYRSKLVYDANSGEVRDDKKHQAMLEDFWLPRREGGKGTEVTTLPGGQNLGEIDDIEYFRRKVYQALNVPLTRMNPESGFQLGRATEISRDEIKFTKFITRIRKKFNHLFNDLLKTQLLLKKVITEKDWIEFEDKIKYSYVKDNHFSELKENEILTARLNLLGDMQNYVGQYFSKEYIKRNVLRLTDAEIENMNQEIEKEKDDPDMLAKNGDNEEQQSGQQPAAPATQATTGETGHIGIDNTGIGSEEE